uniref:Uncharacterized protein n=1 Tax=Rhizophora mucronata TaxID=61149 RepID=A0A2P2II97_RHIMU
MAISTATFSLSFKFSPFPVVFLFFPLSQSSKLPLPRSS